MSFQGQWCLGMYSCISSTGISLFTNHKLMGFYPQKHVMMKYPGDGRRLLLAVNKGLELVAGGASRAFLLISLKRVVSLSLSLLSAADLL